MNQRAMVRKWTKKYRAIISAACRAHKVKETRELRRLMATAMLGAVRLEWAEQEKKKRRWWS